MLQIIDKFIISMRWILYPFLTFLIWYNAKFNYPLFFQTLSSVCFVTLLWFFLLFVLRNDNSLKFIKKLNIWLDDNLPLFLKIRLDVFNLPLFLEIFVLNFVWIKMFLYYNLNICINIVPVLIAKYYNDILDLIMAFEKGVFSFKDFFF